MYLHTDDFLILRDYGCLFNINYSYESPYEIYIIF